MSDPIRIVFEDDGYPRELLGETEWARAIAKGQLRPETPVTIYSDSGLPTACQASNVSELRPMFGLRDAEESELLLSALQLQEGARHGSEAGHPVPVPKPHAHSPVQESGIRLQLLNEFEQTNSSGAGSEEGQALSEKSINYAAADGRVFPSPEEARRHSRSPEVLAALDQRRRSAPKKTARSKNLPLRDSLDRAEKDKLFNWILASIILLAIVFW